MALRVSAQAPNEALEWSVALGGRFRQMQDPVVAAYALAVLGEQVCPVDRAAGAGLFRDSLNRINTLSDTAFRDARRRLPVSSLSRLWKTVTSEAFRCDAGLTQFVATASIRNRLLAERQDAPALLAEALDRVSEDPDRAAQLADSAMAAAAPDALDITSVAKLLSQLRERAPDLADEEFPAALDFLTSATLPSGAALAQLGSYLFTDPALLDLPDEEMRERRVTVAETSLPVLTATRHGANPDDIAAYIDALFTVMKSATGSGYQAVAAYAVAYQMLPRAREIDPDLARRLQDAMQALQPAAGEALSAIPSAFSGGGPPDALSGEASVRRAGAIRRLLNQVAAGRFAEARQILPEIDDIASKGQVATWVDFAEAAAAIQRHDLEQAFALANALAGGVKRALLYVGLVSATTGAAALESVGMAVKDTEALPAEQRVVLLSAAGAAAARAEPELSLILLGQTVKAANDASRSPRRGRFNPRMTRTAFNASGDISGDSVLVVMSQRGMYEVADTGGQRRFNFPLRVSGVEALDLPGFVRNAGNLDSHRVEAALLSLEDENRRAAALNALAALRLQTRR